MLPPAIRDLIADALLPEPLVHRRQRQLHGYAHIVPDSCGRRAGAAPAAVNGNDVRAASCNAAGNGRDVMGRCHLDNDGLFIFCSFLQ